MKIEECKKLEKVNMNLEMVKHKYKVGDTFYDYGFCPVGITDKGKIGSELDFYLKKRIIVYCDGFKNEYRVKDYEDLCVDLGFGGQIYEEWELDSLPKTEEEVFDYAEKRENRILQMRLDSIAKARKRFKKQKEKKE